MTSNEDLTEHAPEHPLPVPAQDMGDELPSVDDLGATLLEGSSGNDTLMETGGSPDSQSDIAPQVESIEGDNTLMEVAAAVEPSDRTLAEEAEPENTQLEPSSKMKSLPVPARPSAETRTKKSPPQKGQQSPKVFAERFEVEEVLGEGGMGKVYRVRDRQIEGRIIALKVLRPRFSQNKRFRELFFKEIQAAQSFVSEHVTQVRDTGQMKDGTLFLTMDIVDGESLDKVLERESSLVARHALEITRQVLVGLASGHDQGFVHCDIKPPNVMMAARVPKSEDNPFGVGVRVLDFGIANIASEMEAGNVIGTPRYMSPEQVQGQRLDARSDIFSTGVLLFELLSGSRPFDGLTAKEVQTAVLETDVAPLIRDLEHLPEPIRKILAKALQKDREKRFQSAAEFIKAIEVSKSFKAPSGMPKWAIGLGVLLFAASAGEGSMLWMQRGKLDESVNLNLTRQGTINELNSEVARLGGEKTDLQRNQDMAVAKAKEGATASANEAHAIVIGNKDKEITDLVASNAGLEAMLTAIETQESTDSGDRDVADSIWKSRYDEVLKRNDELREVVDTNTARLNSVEYRGRVEYRAASYFDKAVQLIEEGYPQMAATSFLRDSRESDFAIKPSTGLSLMGELIGASASLSNALPLLDLLLPDSDPALQRDALDALRVGKEQLRKAEEEIEVFGILANSWLNEQTESKGESTRLSRVREQLAALNIRLEQLESAASLLAQESQQARQGELESLLALPIGKEPARLLGYLHEYGAKDLVQRIHTTGEWIERQVTSDGALNLKALNKSQFLVTLSPWLLSEEAAPFQQEGLQSMRWLLAAKAWNSSNGIPDKLAGLVGTIPQITSTTPVHNWRAELALAVQLSSTEQYPQAAGEVFFRTDWAGEIVWASELVNRSAQGKWKITRNSVGGDGRLVGVPKLLEVALEQDKLRLDGKEILALRTVSNRVALWDHKSVQDLPSQPWTNGRNNSMFLDSLSAPVPCLIYKGAKYEYWFSPEHGLVRKTDGADFDQVMIFSSTVQ